MKSNTAAKIKGFATPQGTERFRDRFLNRPAERFAGSHFRKGGDLWFSSVGLGTYLGEPDESTDRLYEQVIRQSLTSGINVIDSAINYRAQRSERAIGRAIRDLIGRGTVSREEIILSTKGGFLPFDGSYPVDPAGYFQTEYLDTGLLDSRHIAQGCHAMSPRYLEDQLNRSLENLGMETIDLYYLHNPETQLSDVDRGEFAGRLRAAFEFLERMVSQGRIRMYGTATWSGYRVSSQSRQHLSLEEMVALAKEAGGSRHHFRAVQLPVNVAMPEAWNFPNQAVGGKREPFLKCARHFDILTMASASLLQGRLSRLPFQQLRELFPGLETPSQACLQFARSCPGVVTALVGMRRGEHLMENLAVARVPAMDESQMVRLFQRNQG